MWSKTGPFDFILDENAPFFLRFPEVKLLEAVALSDVGLMRFDPVEKTSSTGSYRSGGRGCPGADLYHHCSVISFSMNWIRNWNGECIGSADRRVMRTCA
jgi:hypothetical protein